MDHKAKRRKFIKTVEVVEYERQQRNKGKIQERLNEVGYRSESEYADAVSYLAW